MSFQRAKQDQASIREGNEAVIKQISEEEFKIHQLDQAIRLATHEKEKEILERKRQME